MKVGVRRSQPTQTSDDEHGGTSAVIQQYPIHHALACSFYRHMGAHIRSVDLSRRRVIANAPITHGSNKAAG